MKSKLTLAACAAALALGMGAPSVALAAKAAPEAVAVLASAPAGSAPLIVAGRPAQVLADPGDDPAALRAVQDLRVDLQTVAGLPKTSPLPRRANDGPTIIIGTIGKSELIDGLIKAGKLDVSGVTGQWEAFVQQVVDHPAPGIERALVIAGADKRGTVFGVYDLSERIGVSPWAWWADVPVPVRKDLSAAPGRRTEKPTVRYRGIFLNDEDPSLLTWVDGTFGGFNHAFYEKLFALMLRMKANYLWPAMWGKSFFDDDPLNAVMADEYGVVIGTSHHEPMMRANIEWRRYGSGPWDYTKNAAKLRDFWRKGIERMDHHESLVTIGMRGDGDMPMTTGTATGLLEQIVADQRKIIGEVTGKDPSKTPQVWALYKEVQDYYDKGMRVPEDVTLLFSDDNWGNNRRLPSLGAKPRAGGYGIYYHFDYVGGPRNYKWINTNQVERTWEQMRLADDYGADQLWIVNVGDLKPMELPTQFFLDYAWNPKAWPLAKMADYTRRWAAEQFGDEHAAEIAALLDGYTRLNAQRKPELLSPQTYSLVNDREAERVLGEWDDLDARASRLAGELPKAYQDAFFELVRYPIEASANLNHLYVAAARNRLYAAQGRASADHWADEVKARFARDAELSRQYNHDLAGGKWNGMMLQTHIGYTSWQEPKVDIMPTVTTTTPLAQAGLGVALEGDPRGWAAGQAGASLPPLERQGVASRWIDVFDRGQAPLRFTASAGAPWVKVTPAAGQVGPDTRLEVSVDWKAAPSGTRQVPITIRGDDGQTITVQATVANTPAHGRGFQEADGYVSMLARDFSRAAGASGLTWQVIPGLGPSDGAVEAYPTAAPSSAAGAGPYLQYDVALAAPGKMQVQVTTAPTLDFRGEGGLRYAVSLDGAPPQIVQLPIDRDQRAWAKAVSDDAVTTTAEIEVPSAGAHRLRLWRIDPGVVFEKVVLTRKDLPPTYLGPPESLRR